MPSVGAASAIVMGRRIEAAITREFAAADQADARHMLALADAGGDPCWQIFLWAGVACVVLAAVAWADRRWNGPETAPSRRALLWFLGLAAVFWGVSWHMHESRDAARRELDALVAGDPAHWRPIQAKLEKIVLEAGQFPEGRRSSVTHGECKP